jgi:hypothetical protein
VCFIPLPFDPFRIARHPSGIGRAHPVECPLDDFSAELPRQPFVLTACARVRGSHCLFRKNGVEDKINLQRAGTNAKPYRVKQVGGKQVRAAILRAKLGLEP